MSSQSQSSISKEKDLGKEKLEAEFKAIKKCKEIIDTSWAFEVDLYEQNVEQDPLLIHVDPRIFPYHKKCYLLLDMYAGLEKNMNFPIELREEHVLGLMGHNRHHFPGVARVEGYLPCSAYAINHTFIPIRNRLEADNNGELIYSFHSYWKETIQKDKEAFIQECYRFSSYDEAHKCSSNSNINSNSNGNSNSCKDAESEDQDQPLIEGIPKGLRTKVLLKLLKHSMSELQSDHRLANAVVISMIENKCFDGDGGVEALRYFLLTFFSQYIYGCDGNCHETYLFNTDESDDETTDDDSDNPRPTHYCDDYQVLHSTIEYVISDGIKLMTEDHANLLVAFVTRLYEASGWNEVEHMKKLIGYDDDNSITHDDKPHRLIGYIISGLGIKAYEDRCRLKTLLRWKYSTTTDNLSTSHSKEINDVLNSHLQSLDVLTRIGKATLIRLPADTMTELIGSRLLRCLVLASIDLIPHKDFSRLHISPEEKCFIGDLFGGQNESITNPTRYSDGINSFKMKNKRLDDIKTSFMDSWTTDEFENDAIIQQIFLSPPSAELQSIVKGLFLSQLIDVDYSGCGYGDFLVWCRLPIHIYEPMLYEHIVNYPYYLDNDNDSDSDDSEDDERLIYHDDEGKNVVGVRRKALYDFSLLTLKQIWKEPWSPKNHSSFQLPFRDAVWTLILCAHRYGMSSDIPIRISAFLPRDWWSDERVKCWRYECEIDNISHLIYKHEVRKSKALIACGGCKTAHACSQKHLAAIHRDGHHRSCKLPPLRSFNDEDAILCQDILGRSCVGTEIENKEDTDNDDDDDDSCWESIGSNEDISGSKTEVIYRYFENKAYKMYRMEEPAFAAFYADE